MLKYSDLTKRFIEFRREQDEYWEHLQNAAFQLLKDLEVSLELPLATWSDETGKVFRYVDIGTSEKGEFKRVHPMQFQGPDLQYSFEIRITLEESQNQLPKGFYIQKVTLSANEKDIAVTLASYDGNLLLSAPKEIEDGQFSQVVEVIKLKLMDALTLKISG